MPKPVVALAMIFAVVLHAGAAMASARVLLLESPPSTRGLRDALIIQLPHGTELDVQPFDVGGTIATRLRAARGRLIQSGGRMALWVEEWERTETGREVVAYFVAQSGDRALIEIVRVRGKADDERERAIAIKSVVVLEALDASQEKTPSGRMLDADRDRPAATRDGSSSEGMTRAGPVFQLAGLGALSEATDSQGMAAAGVGFGLRIDRTLAEALGIARLATPLSAQSTAGVLSASETYVGGSLRGGRSIGSFRLGLFFDFGARLLSVDGKASGGTRGSSERSVPALSFGPEMRLELRPWLELRGALGVEMMLREQRFSVNRDPILDLGAARSLLELGLVAAAW